MKLGQKKLLPWLLCLLALLGTGAAPEPPPAQNAVRAVETVGMTVHDMDRAVEFYSKVLSFEKISDVEVWGSPYEDLQGIFGLRMRVVRMRLGQEDIELTEYLTPKGRPTPLDFRSNDHWFQHIAIVVGDMDKAYEQLRSHKVRHASTGPQRIPDWNQAAAGIRAFYFRDPDGHHLEIIHFPPAKGDPRWRGRTDRLFLGIDHTAIVVSITDESLKFYRDLLGMRVAGESENYGPEQERLNNVFGARLRITALKAPSGPGIELLEYLTPQDGRPTPKDIRANDLAHWQTTLLLASTDEAERKLRRARSWFVSSGTVAMPEEKLGFRKALLVRDADGHGLRFVER